MAWTQTDIDAVEAAIRAKVTGGAIARYSIRDRSIEYMSLQDLIVLRSDMRREMLEEAAGTSSFALVDLRE